MGLDIGSTTSSAVVARAEVLKNSVTHRMELAQAEVIWRSPMTFTPFTDSGLDAGALEARIDGWIAASGTSPRDLAAGGALVTGLAARASNAAVIRALVAKRFPESFVAVANDPHLESWLAFHGNCGRLSREDSDAYYLNLDIGGGTTNWALGKSGEVLQTGWLYLGARHILPKASVFGVRQSALFGNRVIEYYVDSLEKLSRGEPVPHPEVYGDEPILPVPVPDGPLRITFSGGVAELYYHPPPPGTDFGDLGVRLAEALRRSVFFQEHAPPRLPETLGRATVQGLALHNVEISGTSVHLSDPAMLPLSALPILGEEMALRRGGCVALDTGALSLEELKRYATDFGARIASNEPLVAILGENRGKVFGAYATDWGSRAPNLVVLDEIRVPQARFVNIGKPKHQVVPVSFYGMRSR